MLKEDYGAECKVCTRPFTVFSWAADRAHGRKKRTNICLTCARLKNCCQACMLDLSFGLPLTIRDAALKMVAPGPSSEINREYFAQNNEKAIEDGSAGTEEYEKTDEKASTEKDAVAEVEGGKAKTTKKLRSIRHPPEGMLKTSGARNSERKKNIKFDPSTLPETDNPDLIRTQVRGNKNPICAPVYNS